MLGIINCGIFYQEAGATGKKMLNIGALMVSYVALLPTVRVQTTVSPTITFTEILVFLQATTSIFSLAQMLEVKGIADYDEDMATDGWLIASVIITAIVATSIFIMMMLHKFVWKKAYHRQE
jgi:hypothetical protein